MRKPNITETPEAFAAAVMTTPFGAVCVKKRGPGVMDDDYGHGILVNPPIVCGMIHGPEDLAKMLRDDFREPFVTVRGHGWSGEKRFVWCGTTEQFNAIWKID